MGKGASKKAPRKAQAKRSASSATPAELDRDRLHQLVDRLPETEVAAAERLLVSLQDQNGSNEVRLTERDKAALREGFDDLAAGRVVSHEAMRSEFGW